MARLSFELDDADVPPPYFSVPGPPPSPERSPVVDAVASSVPTSLATAIPGPRSNSPPPSYDNIVAPGSTAGPASAGCVSPYRGRFALFRLPSSFSRSEPPRPDTAIKEEAVLASVLESHRWPRTWGPRPKTLHHALTRASLFGAEPLVRALLAAGAPIRFTGKYAASRSTSAVHEALRGPAPNLAITLISHFFSVSYATALAHAHPRPTSAADEARAIEIADENTHYLLNARDGEGCTPLHLAAQAGETEIVGEMVLRGSEVDAQDDLGRTPLHMASRYSRLETVRFLLRSGADPSKIAEELWTSAASERAALGSYGLITNLLIEVQKGRHDDVHQHHEPSEGLLPGEQFTAPAPCASGNPSPATEEGTAVTGPNTRETATKDSRGKVVSGPNLSACSSRSGPNAFSSLSGESWASQPVLSPEAKVILESSLSSLGRSPRCLRHAPGSMLNSPEYAVWIRDCQVLHAEHLAQKARDRRSNNG